MRYSRSLLIIASGLLLEAVIPLCFEQDHAAHDRLASQLRTNPSFERPSLLPRPTDRAPLSPPQRLDQTLVRSLQNIWNIPDPDSRSDALEQLVHSVPQGKEREILDGLDLNSGPAADIFRTQLVRRWSQSDLKSARDWSLSLPEGPARRAALEQVATVQSSTDPAAASEWAKGLDDTPSDRAAKMAVAYEAARTDPVQALDLASSLPPTPERNDLLAHAVSQWSSMDFTNAASWALGINDPELRNRLVGTVATGAAEQNPSAAAGLVAMGVEAGPEQDRAAISVLQRWAQESPEDAAAWISNFPQAQLRTTGLNELLTAWVRQDPSGAQAWVMGLPEGELQETGIAAYDGAISAQNRAVSTQAGAE